MRSLRTPSPRHLVALAAAAVGAFGAAAAAPAAHAGTYTVGVCQSSDTFRTSSWTPDPAQPAAPVVVGDRCGDNTPTVIGTNAGLDITASYGFWATTPAPAGTPNAEPGRVAGYRFTAPSGVTIKDVALVHEMSVASADWEIRADATVAPTTQTGQGQNAGQGQTTGATPTTVATCAGPTAAEFCGDGVTERDSLGYEPPAGTTAFDIAAWCKNPAGCAYDTTGRPTFGASIANGYALLEDLTFPEVGPPVVAGLAADGSAMADATLTLRATDALGLRSLSITDAITGKFVHSVERECVDWSTKPCAEPSAGGSTEMTFTIPVAELGLPNGVHQLRARAVDGGNNALSSQALTLRVGSAPKPAEALTGGGRANSLTRELHWVLPIGSTATKAKVEMCKAASPGDCVLVSADLNGPLTFNSDQFPDHLARVVLIDDQGSEVKSEPLHYLWDTAAPRQPKVKLVSSTGDTRLVEFAVDPADDDVDSYKAQLCTAPANKCTALTAGKIANRDATQLTVRIPNQGGFRLDVELTDTAGNRGLPGQLSLNYSVAIEDLKVTDKPLALTPRFPKKLAKTSVLIKGTALAGSAAKVTVTVAGRNKKGKAVKTVKAVKPGATGAWAVRVKLPPKLNRKKGVLVTVAATPNKGFIAATTRKRLKG